MSLRTEKEPSEKEYGKCASNIQRENAHAHNVNRSKLEKYFVPEICDHRGRDFGDHEIFQSNIKIDISKR